MRGWIPRRHDAQMQFVDQAIFQPQGLGENIQREGQPAQRWFGHGRHALLQPVTGAEKLFVELGLGGAGGRPPVVAPARLRRQ